MGDGKLNNFQMNDTEKPVVLYDGVCNLCTGVVQFVIKHDPDWQLNFASLQSAIGQKILNQYHLDGKTFDSFVFIKSNIAYTHSTAALMLAANLGFPWRMLSVFLVLPKPFRDSIYRFIARNRYKWFGQKSSCMMPNQDIIKRFLDWGEPIH